MLIADVGEIEINRPSRWVPYAVVGQTVQTGYQ